MIRPFQAGIISIGMVSPAHFSKDAVTSPKHERKNESVLYCNSYQPESPVFKAFPLTYVASVRLLE